MQRYLVQVKEPSQPTSPHPSDWKFSLSPGAWLTFAQTNDPHEAKEVLHELQEFYVNTRIMAPQDAKDVTDDLT